MLNAIMDAVTQKLDELFGDEYTIYKDTVDQGLTEPCFFVQFLEPSQKQMIGRRYLRKTDMSIQYLPKETSETLRELNRAAEILMDGMEYITLSDGSVLRGTGLSAKPDQETRVLTFLVSYNVFVYRQQGTGETMDGLEVRGGVK